jgi:pimeloyl-ACP methyl ester carboxylesterase
MQGVWIRRGDAATPSMAVVFVHGILSSNEACWRHENGSHWPTLLAEHPPLADVGIYAFTYQSAVFSGSYSLGNVVDSLKESLALDGVISAHRIVFVAHSMGGIVARRYIVQRLDELVERGTEVGLFLLASPSLGSPYATWLGPIARFMGHSQAAALAFCESNTWLNDLNSDFRNVLARRSLVIHGKELIEDKFIVLKRLHFLKQVVPPISGATYFGEAYKVPDSDHFSIAKPASFDSIQNRLLVQFIVSISQSRLGSKGVTESNGEVRTIIGNCEIRVTTGRIEDYPVDSSAVVALPCNEYFDPNCAEDSRSALGIYVNRHLPESVKQFSLLIQEESKRVLGDGVDQQKTKDEVGRSYGVGRALLIQAPFGHHASIALVSTTTQRAGQGLAARISYLFDGMRDLFAVLADARINEVVMPVMGAGHGGIKSPLAFVGLVLALAEAAKYGPELHRRKRVTIVVFRRSQNDPPEVALATIRRALALVANND